jgi:hypothetical protein
LTFLSRRGILMHPDSSGSGWSLDAPGAEALEAFWWAPGAEVPRDREAAVAWLFSRWKRVDAWIEAHREDRVR